MKQSAAKTLGVAALGVAFAAAGAGAANAAPSLADTTGTVPDTVNRTLPAENLDRTVPGASEALAQGQTTLEAGLRAAQPAAEQVLAEGPTGPFAHLLGGLPVQGLPTPGLSVNGVPLG
ncbi:ATP-binding protein [Streptomyces sp. JB150]|uniref:ATP-binding protein n=1 Tax=Streptomyces sp. JB150 TaxID=2714844 RepID=UPI00140DDEDE|nr:ATP-binding protein [Streptomyces sp. JB150]QIJ64379.1 ATP-binding protein [Streptomyces sp. JB150]